MTPFKLVLYNYDYTLAYSKKYSITEKDLSIVFNGEIDKLKFLATNLISSRTLEYQGKDKTDVEKYTALFSVMKDTIAIQDAEGNVFKYIVTDTHAGANLPGLFPGTTTSDVEVSIHSHPTKVKVVGNQVFGSNATQPTNADAGTFSQYKTNIIIGRLGQPTATQGIDKQTGQNATTISKPKSYVVIFNNGGTTPSFQFSRNKVEKIIGNQ